MSERFKTFSAICLLVAMAASIAAAFGVDWVIGCIAIAVWAAALGYAANECRKDEENKDQ